MRSCKVTMQIAVGLVAMLACVLQVQAGPRRLNNFKDVLGAAREMESALLLISGKTADRTESRNEILYAFMREPKSHHCEQQLADTTKVINEYKIKAYSFVDDSKKPKNWFSSMTSKIAGPIGAMKNLGKFAASLNKITERYESQQNSGLLSHVDIDCDMNKFQIRSLDAILFVLQTDVHSLITEDRTILNRAIYEQLKANKYVAHHNFYEVDGLTPGQQELLMEFYASRVLTSSVTVGQALNHFSEPGPYIVGRLLDTCHEVPKYMALWKETDDARADVCEHQLSDPNNKFFTREFPVDKYSEIGKFCSDFLDAL